MKRYFKYNNEDYDILKTGSIGAAATIAHDFFIAPSDSKNQESWLFSDKTAFITPTRTKRVVMRTLDYQRRRIIRNVSVLPSNGTHEYTFHDNSRLRKWELKDLDKTLVPRHTYFLVFCVCRSSRCMCCNCNQSFGRHKNSSPNLRSSCKWIT